MGGDRPWLTMDALGRHDPQPQRHGHHQRYICPLPACTARDHKNDPHSLNVDMRNGTWKCHSCGAGGQLEDFRPDLRRMPRDQFRRRQALRTMFPRSSLPPPPPDPEEEQRQAAAAARYAQCASLADTVGADYLAQRGIPLDLAHAAGVRYGIGSGNRPAVVFPIRDQAGELVAIACRYLDEGHPTKRSHGRIKAGIFATPGALTNPHVAIVEAAIDALSLAAAGLPAVALIGTSTGPTWLRKALAPARVYLAHDADPDRTDGGQGPGDTAAAALCDILCLSSKPTRLRPPQADPSEKSDWNSVLQERGITGLATLLLANIPTNTNNQPLSGIAGNVATLAVPEKAMGDNLTKPNSLTRGGALQNATATPTFDELLAKAARELDARCGCGARASHLKADGTWQCPACAGLPVVETAEPDPELAAAAVEYERLRGETLDLQGAAIRARDAGDQAEHTRLSVELRVLIAGPYRLIGERIAALADRSNA